MDQQLYLIEILHQTTTFPALLRKSPKLYLIEILHQTTTAPSRCCTCRCCILSKFYIKPQRLNPSVSNRACCILSKFYIKPQQQRSLGFSYVVVSYRNSTSNHNRRGATGHGGMLYLIEILHQTTTSRTRCRSFFCCILSKFYIKPQRFRRRSSWSSSCILSKFYIKPQPELSSRCGNTSCILSKFYIKPQLARIRPYSAIRCILSKFYIKPQPIAEVGIIIVVVSYRNSTSNHNDAAKSALALRLYLIEILHQTTTFVLPMRRGTPLYLIEILHQTTTLTYRVCLSSCCILSKFYIKPQLENIDLMFQPVVSYRNSTSNHNSQPCQLLRCFVVSYRNSTSNHNRNLRHSKSVLLYLIEILHQTTTNRPCCRRSGRCILSKFYIKPQRITPDYLNYQGCILSKFYIKPQLSRQWLLVPCVVSYRNSTSNHNAGQFDTSGGSVVSYRNSTSNHNYHYARARHSQVVSYRNSTSNHNCHRINVERGEVVSYRNSTSNHNDEHLDRVNRYVVSYRNSTSNHNWGLVFSLIVSVVSYRNSTSNHNYLLPALLRQVVVSYRNSTSNHN